MPRRNAPASRRPSATTASAADCIAARDRASSAAVADGAPAGAPDMVADGVVELRETAVGGGATAAWTVPEPGSGSLDGGADVVAPRIVSEASAIAALGSMPAVRAAPAPRVRRPDAGAGG